MAWVDWLLIAIFDGLPGFFEQFVSNVKGVDFRAGVVNGFSRKDWVKQLRFWRC